MNCNLKNQGHGYGLINDKCIFCGHERKVKMSDEFEKEKIRKMDTNDFIEWRINGLRNMLELKLTYEKDLIYSALLDEYLLIKTFLKY